ncbi:MAG: amidohydrolase family protein [Candidatus Hodarchaeales archaeon]
MEQLEFSSDAPLNGLNQIEYPLFDAHFHVWDPRVFGQYKYVAKGYGLDGFLVIADPDTRKAIFKSFPGLHTYYAYYLSTKAFAHYDHPELVSNLDEAQKHEYKVVKAWFGPRFLDWAGADGPFRLDSPQLSQVWSKIEECRFIVDIHIGDPDIWYTRDYQDPKYGTKAEALTQFGNVLGKYPSVQFIGVHMAGHPEHLATLSDFLDEYPNLVIDTASTRWMIRELGKEEQREATRDFFLRYSSRILFGSDLSVRGEVQDSYYQTRYWSQRLFWETTHVAPLPFEDKDNPNGTVIHGLNLPKWVLRKFYWENAIKLLNQA